VAPAHDPTLVTWRVHMRASRSAVYDVIATATGRRRFWAESAEERDGAIEFRFSNGTALLGRCWSATHPAAFPSSTLAVAT
jgi:hypothetical protein